MLTFRRLIVTRLKPFPVFKFTQCSNSYKVTQPSLLTKLRTSLLITMSRRGTATSNSTELTVKSCDFFRNKNESLHHTEEFDNDIDNSRNRLVVRRGQSFIARLTMSRAMKFPEDNLAFRLQTGKAPRTTHHSLIHLKRIAPEAGDKNLPAGIKYATVSGVTELDVEVFLPADMGVGEWSLWLHASVPRRRTTDKSRAIENLIVLFNPWCKEDQTYMKNDKWRQEYVLNEDGILYYGSSRRIGAMSWDFDQFNSYVLDAALALMNKYSRDKLTYRERSDAALVSRHMSAMVNSNDESGVLVGNWSGDYDDGISPTEWTSSAAIIKQYMTENEPVKYGQCWVFSGVLCSILRCLGLPARSVTNFESAHDTDANLTVDYHYDANDNPEDNDDSVWNFHVWNDVWMARPDLPEGYGGWQALDATPQESSGGLMQCGPMSVNAIKQGYIKHNFDGSFIYAEVNATKRHWKRDKNDEDKWIELMSNTSAVGKNISTKAVGSTDREDVTLKYKYEEGTPEETLSFKVARSFVKFTHKEKAEKKEAIIEFDVDIPDVVQIGDGIDVKFTFRNVSSKSQDVFVSVIAKSMQYNGSVTAKLFDENLTSQVSSKGTRNLSTTLPASKWVGKVKGRDAIKFFVLGGVKGTDQIIAYQEVITVDLPVLVVKAVKGTNVKLGDEVTLNVSFTNPLTTALDGARLTINGGGNSFVNSLGKIKAKENFSTDVKIKASRRGNRRFIAGFTSNSIDGIQGEIFLNVT